MALLYEGALLPAGGQLTFVHASLDDVLLYFQDFRSQPGHLINELPLHHTELGQIDVASWPEWLLMQNYKTRYLVIGCANPEWTAVIGGLDQRKVGRDFVGWGSVGVSAANYLRRVGMPHEHAPVEIFGIEMRITHNDPVDFNAREFDYGTYLLCAIAPYQRSQSEKNYPTAGLDYGSSVYLAHGAFAEHGLQVLVQSHEEAADGFTSSTPRVTVPEGGAVYKHFNHRVVEGWAQQRGIRPFDEDFYSGPAHLFVPYHPDYGYQEQQPRISFKDFQRFQSVNPDYNQWLCQQGLF